MQICEPVSKNQHNLHLQLLSFYGKTLCSESFSNNYYPFEPSSAFLHYTIVTSMAEYNINNIILLGTKWPINVKFD